MLTDLQRVLRRSSMSLRRTDRVEVEVRDEFRHVLIDEAVLIAAITSIMILLNGH